MNEISSNAASHTNRCVVALQFRHFVHQLRDLLLVFIFQLRDLVLVI
jgi:hypothetical protein